MKRMKQEITMRSLRNLLFIPVFLAVVCLTGCSKDDDSIADPEIELDDTDFEASDWTVETHSNDADPNFEEVFNDGEVKRFDFVVTPERWQAMLDDMTSLYGQFGTRAAGPGLVETDENPVFVPAEVFYNGTEWYRVGIRFKGNSSLQSAWGSGVLKLSFKLDFDEFEDNYPQIDNQRFYGFKKLSLKNNYDDPSLMREKVVADVFAEAGMAVSHTAFYTLYVDHGDGPEYFGLYTLVEEVDDSLIDTQYTSDDGNLYKPDGDGASFAAGTFSQSVFEKKTNEDDADWSDIQALFSALHDDSRITDPATFRQNLEAVFDTDVFLKYLAINTVVQNWDTYGIMTHNYYLYNAPETNKLTWIPWDNNEALQTGKRGGALNLNFSNLASNAWPLIEYLYADSEYRAKYDTYVGEFINDVFETGTMHQKYDFYANLIRSYATSERTGYSFLSSAAAFQSGVDALKTHASGRAAAVNSYLQ